MCRLFGFRSTERLCTHHTLRVAENALAKQSTKHPDGWGIGYYIDDQPHVCKRAAAAFQDYEYARISEVVSSPTVIAHVRKATVGELSEHNSHPFRFQRWLGAHNGHIEAFPQVRGLLLDELPKPLVEQIQGTTDSEHLFFLFLSELADFADLDDLDLSLDVAMGAAERALYKVDAWVERFKPNVRSETNLLITNGRLMLALRRGSTLFYATQRGALDALNCPKFQKDALGPLPVDRQINHILVASEPISGEQLWQETPQASILGIDRNLNWRIEPIHQRQHRVRGAKPLPDWPQVMGEDTPEDDDIKRLVPTANSAGDLYGEVALVSGLDSAFGLPTARRLAAEGARLIVHGQDPQTVQALAQQVRRLGGDVYAGYLPTDSEPPSLRLVVERGVEALNVLSVVVALAEADFGALERAVAMAQERLSQRVAQGEIPAVLLRWVLVLRVASVEPDIRQAFQKFVASVEARGAVIGARVNGVIASATANAEDVAQVICFLASTTSRAIRGAVLHAA